MSLGLFRIGKETCAFEHDVDIETLPGESGRAFLDGETCDLVSVDDKGVIFLYIGRRFFTVYFSLETTLNRVVFDKVGEIVSSHEVVDGDDFISFFKKSLFDDGSEH